MTIQTDASPAALLEAMMLVRAFEDQNRGLAHAGAAKGTCTAAGQEAAAVGAVRALAPEDYILTNHRSAGHLLARGADPKRMLAEIMGKATGYCKGRSGSLHISVKELGVVLTSTIVGAELTLAPGVALAASMNGAPSIAACFFGDGAACEGAFHESLNLAAVWNLPVLYLCENNQWQAYVHRRETMLTERLADRAAAYGIEGLCVDGNDVEAVYQATRRAAAEIRRTRRPMLLELVTYRMKGHYEPDDLGYVDPDELAHWAARDPIARYRNALLERGALTGADLDHLAARVRRTVEAALAYAQSSPDPDTSDLTADVYA